MKKKQLEQTVEILLNDREELLTALHIMLVEQQKALAMGDDELGTATEILQTDINYLSFILNKFGYKPEGASVN